MHISAPFKLVLGAAAPTALPLLRAYVCVGGCVGVFDCVFKLPWQLSSQFKHVKLLVVAVPYKGLDVQINRYIPLGKDRYLKQASMQTNSRSANSSHGLNQWD